MTAPRWWALCDASYAGGAEQYLEWLLDGAGHERMGLWVVDGPGLKAWIERQRDSGFRVERIPATGLRSQLQQVRGLAARLRPEVLHVNLPGPYDGMRALAPYVARRGGARRVLVTEHLPGVGRVGKRYWVKRAALGAIDRAISVCEAHAGVLCREFGYRPSRVIAIPNGVPDPNPEGRIAAADRGPLPADLAARERQDALRIVQVAALDPRKGGDVLIEAAAILRASGLEFSLWLVGEGPERPQWERQIAARGLARWVHLAGRRPDVPAIWAASDVAVLASHQEGMPLSLLEAMAHGLPVAATEVDGVGELIRPRRTGCLVPPGDPRALALALADLARDRGRRARWGRAGRRRFEERFTLGRMLSDTFAVYEGDGTRSTRRGH